MKRRIQIQLGTDHLHPTTFLIHSITFSNYLYPSCSLRHRFCPFLFHEMSVDLFLKNANFLCLCVKCYMFLMLIHCTNVSISCRSQDWRNQEICMRWVNSIRPKWHRDGWCTQKALLLLIVLKLHPLSNGFKFVSMSARRHGFLSCHFIWFFLILLKFNLSCTFSAFDFYLISISYYQCFALNLSHSILILIDSLFMCSFICILFSFHFHLISLRLSSLHSIHLISVRNF